MWENASASWTVRWNDQERSCSPARMQQHALATTAGGADSTRAGNVPDTGDGLHSLSKFSRAIGGKHNKI